MATKTKETKAVKKTTSTKTVKKRATTAELKKRIAELEGQNAGLTELYGRLKADFYNVQLKHDAMLGLILQALFVIGIGPDELMSKCSQMFRKKVVAD